MNNYDIIKQMRIAMKKIKRVFENSGIECGLLYFYIHFITEIVCFYSLNKIAGDSILLWIAPLLYDTFAFIPQSLIGYFSDKYPKIKIGLIGIILLILSAFLLNKQILPNILISLSLLSLGNAFIHISGAEITLKTSNGLLSPSAIFVSGGSFGVITGTLLSKNNISPWIILILAITMFPFYFLAEFEKKEQNQKNPCKNFNYHNPKINPKRIIFLTILIVVIRGYMAYGIPTAWKKTTIQAVLLYSFMGFGKALGGILSDIYGAKKIALRSILGSLPFLLFGNHIMWISLIGILLFSMTMSTTLGILVSTLKNTPGLAFGLTTIGLFLGTFPIFVIKINSFIINSILIITLNTFCFIIILKIMKGRST